MKIWNLAVSKADDGSKIIDLQIHGVIDGGWFDDESTSTAEIAKGLAEHPDAKIINQHINSVGGSLFGGIALYNILQAHPAEVTSYVDGLAASAASIIAMAGKTVMGRGAMLMIHNPWAGVAGDAQSLRKAAAMLDKARDSLVSVYKAKTGKDGTELRAMLDATTYLTADEAQRKGFANEVAGGDQAVEDLGEMVAFNAIAFPRTALEPQILAMAAPKPIPAPPEKPAPQGGEKETILEITREILAAKAPDLLKALLDEGTKSGAAAERARLKAIDELPVRGHVKLLADAKYGADLKSAEQVAVAILKAEGELSVELLAARRNESAPAAAVRQSAPEKTTEADETKAAKEIAEHANRRRGGSR